MDYSSWIQHIFDTSLNAKYTPQFDALAASLPPTEALQFVTRIFENCATDLKRFNDLQVAQGLKYIASAGESDWMYLISDRRVSWGERLACIRSILPLYRDCFARRCENSLSCFQAAVREINSVCYMWWDVFPGGPAGMTTEERMAVDAELIGVMSEALQLPHDACRESALHGLGHWESADPSRVRAIVDDWLLRNPDVPQPLIQYAQAAREGHVQ